MGCDEFPLFVENGEESHFCQGMRIHTADASIEKGNVGLIVVREMDAAVGRGCVGADKVGSGACGDLVHAQGVRHQHVFGRIVDDVVIDVEPAVFGGSRRQKHI